MSDTIRILIASDIHAGYGEGKKIIDEDSFIGLEETLSHAAQQDVDFVLLGGDLFHESIPTRYTEHKVISLLRKYCLNDREVAVQMISDPKEVFENSQFKLVNYEDPNINVGLPIFSIHGNHDDFSGKGLMALDILHDAGLVNLFGKFNSVENIVVKPVLLKKGDAKVALYGIGSQRDDRLQRAFNTGKVKFCFPPDVDEWFNILVVHQNRPPRSKTRTTGSFLHLSVLPSQMDLIIWGHEHKCEIEPQFFPKGTADKDDGFFIIQPGSTVATSVSVDETSAKHVAVLEIKGKTFKSKSIPLQGTRQIIVEDLDLAKVQPKPSLAKVKARSKDMEDEKLIHAKLNEMIENAKKHKGPKQPDLPRMRLRVIYSDEWLKIPPANCRIIGHKYDGKVANPSEIISIKTIRPDKEKDVKEKGKRLSRGGEGTTVHDLLRESCRNMESGLGILSLQLMQQYVDVSTKLTESKKKKFQLLEQTITEQIDGYKAKISVVPLRNMVTPNDVETKAAGDAAPPKRSKDDNSNIDLKEFVFKEVLASDPGRKSIFVLIEHNLSKQQGVLICDKQAFSEDGESITAWMHKATFRTVAINDIYGNYVLTLPDEYSGVKTTIVYPATEKHIAKYKRQDIFVVYETAEDYKSITKPYFESLNNVNWVYNILDGNAEQDRVQLHDKNEETGFLLAPDIKWDGTDVETLYYQAIVQRRDIGSIRELTKEHIPLLKAIRDKSTELISEKFGLNTSQLKFYFHYHPTYFHLHVHIVNVKYDAPGCTMTCIPLEEVIDNLEIWPDFYQRATLSFIKKRDDQLLKNFVAAGRVEL